MDNHPILLICMAFAGGAGITHGIWLRIARQRQKAIDAWHNLNLTATGNFIQAPRDAHVTTSNKMQQRVTVGAEDE